MKVSPGCISAMNTSALAEAPECGCTLAKPQPNKRVDALDRQPLGDIDELAAAVIALAGQALRHICWSAPSLAPRARRG